MDKGPGIERHYGLGWVIAVACVVYESADELSLHASPEAERACSEAHIPHEAVLEAVGCRQCRAIL